MKRFPRRGLAVLAAVTMLAAAGCTAQDDKGGSGNTSGGSSGSKVPGVTDTEIKIGTHTPLSGVASGGYKRIAPAAKAYFDYVNANGGVHGRKINYIIKDDGYNPANTNTAVRDLVLKENVFAIMGGLGTPTHTSVLDFLSSNEVPDLFVSSGSTSWNNKAKHPGTFGFNPDYTVEGKILGAYVKKEHEGKKVCFLGQDDDFGRDALIGVKKSVDVAESDKYVTSAQNLGPQAGKFKQAGCEVVVLATIPPFTAAAIGAGAQIGFFPKYVVSNVGSEPATIAGILKENAEKLMEGVVASNYLPLSNMDDNKWIQLFKKVNAEYGGNQPFDNTVVYGMSSAYLTVQALLAAGKDLTRKGLIEAVEKNGFKGGPGLVPLRFSPDDHSGYGGVQLTKISKLKPSFFGPIYETDSKDGEVKEYTEKPADPPANGVPSAS